MIPEKTIDLIVDTLAKLADSIHLNTGEKIIIGYSFTDGAEEIREGAVSAGHPDYGTACKMMVGMTSYVSDYYS